MQVSNIKATKCNFEDNERNTIFKDLKGETLFKLPGEIDGEMFQISGLFDCTTYIMDHSSNV
jgi:hypothetical protein